MLSYNKSFTYRLRQRRGFTLIELMIVIAVVAILVALAVPAYLDYAIRAKVAECIQGAAPAKLAISEYRQTIGDWPPDMDTAALSSSGSTTFCVGFNGYNPATGSFQIDVNEPAIYPTLGQVQPQLTPQQTSVYSIAWFCSMGGTAPENLKYLPSTCRGT